jgi:hypothetical protein
MSSRYCEFVDSRLRRSPPDRASAVPMDKPGKTQCVSPTLPTGRRLPNKLHSTPHQHGMILFWVSGNDQTTSRLPAFSLFFPGSCPDNRDRRKLFKLIGDRGQIRAGRFIIKAHRHELHWVDKTKTALELWEWGCLEIIVPSHGGPRVRIPPPPAERVCCEPGSLDQVPLAALAIALLASFAHSSARTRQCRGAHPGSDDGHPLPQGHDRRGQYFFREAGPADGPVFLLLHGFPTSSPTA